MRIEYDREADALYIWIAEARAARTEELGGGVNLDYDEGGRLLGIEVIGVSERYTREDLGTLTTQNLLDIDPKVSA